MTSRCLVLSIVLVLTLGLIFAAKAAENEAEHDAKQLEKKIAAIEDKEKEEKVRLYGLIEYNYEYLDLKDIDDDQSGSSSDFFLSSVAFAFSAIFNEWSRAQVEVEFEDIGKEEADADFKLEEAIVALKAPWTALYVIGGKTVMPFGVFEDHLIEGTLAEDLYEIDEFGATLGFAPDFWGLNISFSIYENTTILDNLQDFDTFEYRADREKDDHFRSYIANVTLEPAEETLSVSAFYNSEPGDGRRNESIGGAFSLDIWKFRLDIEYITALQREDDEDGRENKESAAVVGLAFDVLDWLQLATRYEDFDDDDPGDQDEVLDYRFIAGFNYFFLHHLNIPYLEDAAFTCEYRFSKYEREKDSPAADSQKMLQFQMAIEF